MTRGVLERVRRELRESPAAPAGIVALAVILYWSARDGATDPLVWAPGSLLLVALLVVVSVTAPGSPPGGRAGMVALAAFAAFVAWCYLSILWADVDADAWSGANKTLAFFAVYALFAVRPWHARAAAAFLGAYSLGVTAIGISELVSVAPSDQPTLGFLEGRLAAPISYSNASVALYLSAALPAVFLASRKQVPALLRPLFLASAGVLAELALLCQSRMSLIAAPVVLVAYIALVPNRLRSLIALGVLAVVVGLSSPRLLDVYEAVFGERGIAQAVSAAREAILVSGIVLLVVGAAWTVADRRLVVAERTTRVASRLTAALAVIAILVAGFAFLRYYGDPAAQAERWWQSFKVNDAVNEAETPHIVSGFAGSGRYDIWRVAISIFTDHPVVGAGVDNFSVDYLRERTIDDNPLYPHSLVLRTLQQTGIIGTLLLAGFIAAAVVAGWATMRRGPPGTRGVAVVALLVFGYWFVHGMIDWLWEIPALSAAAFAGLGLYVALGPVERPRSRPWLAWVGACLIAVVALVSLGAAWLSAREVDAALRTWRATPAAAFDHLDRARLFDPFSDEPDVLGAVIAAERGDVQLQRALLVRGLRRNPDNWYPYLELGLLAARQGDRAEALRLIARADALNPIESTIRFAREKVREGDVPTREQIDRRILRDAAVYTNVTVR